MSIWGSNTILHRVSAKKAVKIMTFNKFQANTFLKTFGMLKTQENTLIILKLWYIIINNIQFKYLLSCLSKVHTLYSLRNFKLPLIKHNWALDSNLDKTNLFSLHRCYLHTSLHNYYSIITCLSTYTTSAIVYDVVIVVNLL